MESLVKIFEDPETNQYFTDDSGLIWIHGHLLCKKLGFENPGRDIKRHTEADERQQIETPGTLNPPWFVNEYGVWGMILAAKTPEAKEFKRFLKYDVLPSIRQQGYYIDSSATSEQLAQAQEQIAQMQARMEGLETRLENDLKVIKYQDRKINKQAEEIKIMQGDRVEVTLAQMDVWIANKDIKSIEEFRLTSGQGRLPLHVKQRILNGTYKLS